MPMPNMANTLNNWQVPITLQIVKQDIVNGDLVISTKKINFLGCWQPLSDEKIQFKEEGVRSWAWFWLHTKTNLKLKTADKVYFKNTRYKVMSIKDYGLNGFYEYELVEDYESST